MLRELEDVAAFGELVTAALSDEQLRWRPGAKRWSVGEVLEHLALTARFYQGAMDAALARAGRDPGAGPPAAEGCSAREPTLTWLERTFVRLLEPPVKRRFPAPGSFVPLQVRRRGELGADFAALHRRLAERLRAAATRDDLDAVRVPSPGSRLLSFRLGAAFAVLTTHARRHLWQIEQVRQAPGFPAA
jgi:hypothetical protein